MHLYKIIHIHVEYINDDKHEQIRYYEAEQKVGCGVVKVCERQYNS